MSPACIIPTFSKLGAEAAEEKETQFYSLSSGRCFVKLQRSRTIVIDLQLQLWLKFTEVTPPPFPLSTLPILILHLIDEEY